MLVVSFNLDEGLPNSLQLSHVTLHEAVLWSKGKENISTYKIKKIPFQTLLYTCSEWNCYGIRMQPRDKSQDQKWNE